MPTPWLPRAETGRFPLAHGLREYAFISEDPALRGVKRGAVFGETDDYSYNIVRDPVHIHDLNATVLHLLGIDHERLTFRHQGRDYRLTDVHGEVVKGVLA